MGIYSQNLNLKTGHRRFASRPLTAQAHEESGE